MLIDGFDALVCGYTHVRCGRFGRWGVVSLSPWQWTLISCWYGSVNLSLLTAVGNN